MNKKNILVLFLLASLGLPAAAQTDSIAITGNAFVNQIIEVGANKSFSRAQSTASASVITNDNVNKRSAKNIGSSILGQGNGLVSLQNSGTYAEANPTFYVRGLQSLSGSSPLILVDGIERDITLISPEEVETVTILKDAAATALYGYKGANGAIQIITKRGKYNSQDIKVTYDHLFNYQVNRPKFVDAYTYGCAMNEALANEGSAAKYSDSELAAFKSGQYPYQYANVNWVDETFRHHGVTNKYNVEFSGGGSKFRYYAMLNLLSDKGFIKNYDYNDKFSTQDKFVQGNMRVNLDIDATKTTKIKVNLLGFISESSRPGAATDMWNLVYSVPSAAFPIKQENGDWGGSTTWAGTLNPVAQSSDAGYYRVNNRSLLADITLNQDLSSFWKGLSATIRTGYDNTSTIYDSYSKNYVYGYYSPSTWTDGIPTAGTYNTGGAVGELTLASDVKSWTRRFHFDAGFNFERQITKNDYLYSSLRWDYEYSDYTGTNTTVYRQTATWYTHYGYKNRYFGELSLVTSGSSRLAPGNKWAFAPTLSAAWVMSNESWMKNVKWVDFLKFRASYGQIDADYLPSNTWTYYTQSYSTDGVTYPFNSGYDSTFGRTTLGQMATDNPTHEKAYKYNFGLDATLFGGLNLEADAYYQRRSDIWVSGAGAYSALIGFDAPYTNAGIVNNYGFETSADYTHKFGQIQFNIGASFSLNKNKIVEQAEEPRAYSNLEQTGNPLSSTYGLIAIGLFQSEEDIANSPTQKFSTVRPGDIKYEDVNKDGVIDANDVCKIGYSTIAPEIYYTFHLGAEWKGIGIDAMFQGTGRYSAILNTKSMYWGLVGNTTISQYAYDNRWTAENPNAIFPRLSSSSNANNYQTSTFWLRDRSFLKLRNVEVYYNLPKSLLQNTKIVNAAKVYLRGVDLFCFDHLDEVDAESYGATNPRSRSIVAGVSVTF